MDLNAITAIAVVVALGLLGIILLGSMLKKGFDDLPTDEEPAVRCPECSWIFVGRGPRSIRFEFCEIHNPMREIY